MTTSDATYNNSTQSNTTDNDSTQSDTTDNYSINVDTTYNYPTNVDFTNKHSINFNRSTNKKRNNQSTSSDRTIKTSSNNQYTTNTKGNVITHEEIFQKSSLNDQINTSISPTNNGIKTNNTSPINVDTIHLLNIPEIFEKNRENSRQLIDEKIKDIKDTINNGVVEIHSYLNKNLNDHDKNPDNNVNSSNSNIITDQGKPVIDENINKEKINLIMKLISGHSGNIDPKLVGSIITNAFKENGEKHVHKKKKSKKVKKNNNQKSSVMIISGSSGTNINSRNINNKNSHNGAWN